METYLFRMDLSVCRFANQYWINQIQKQALWWKSAMFLPKIGDFSKVMGRKQKCSALKWKQLWAYAARF